ncbi:MAG: PepSY-associated TM helix domain-containing protein [Paraglaciecola sp.]|uniref:PepSY-associated TM helix domain-containing protein n=1 Tax=Paraglaciecola sp. TaxID=1920173 RepID=UPI0032983358
MKPDFRKNMVWLHTYSGLVMGWLLFTIFLTGTLAYFNPEITQWMKPELQKVSNTANMLDRSLDELHARGEGASGWSIYLPNNRTEHWYIQWGEGRRNRTTLSLGPEVKQVIEPRESAGGNFFRVFHYTLQLRGYGGRYYSGIAAMFMLVAVFSGIFTHRRFFRDFFTLRISKLQKALTDFHGLIGIVTMPFCIMICATGIMVYVIMYMPFSSEHYVGTERQLSSVLSPGLDKLTPKAANSSPISDFSEVEKKIEMAWGEKQIRRVTFEQPFTEAGRIIVDRIKDSTLSRQSDRLVFSAHTGEPLKGYLPASTAAEVRRVFFGLHEAHFADTRLRWVLFLLGLLSSALIASGLTIWLVKRLNKVRKRHLSHFLVERLNIAVIAGLPLTIMAFFLSNRLLPVMLESRAEIEVQVFLWTWLLCFLHSFLRPARNAWVEQLWTTALCCFLLPMIDLMQDSQRLLEAFNQLNLPYLIFTVSILIVGACFMKTAVWLTGKPMTNKPYKGSDKSSC